MKGVGSLNGWRWIFILVRPDQPCAILIYTSTSLQFNLGRAVDHCRLGHRLFLGV